MARIERSIEVRASPEKIWEILTDYDLFPSLMKSVKKVEYLTEKRGVGSKTHWIVESGGNQIEWEADTTEWIENKKVGWSSTSGDRSIDRAQKKDPRYNIQSITNRVEVDLTLLIRFIFPVTSSFS